MEIRQFNQFGGNTSIGAASTLLMLRTIAVWNKKLYIVIPLVILSLGQWGILLHGVTTVKAHWEPTTQSCSVDAVEGLFLNLVYLWSTLIPTRCSSLSNMFQKPWEST